MEDPSGVLSALVFFIFVSPPFPSPTIRYHLIYKLSLPSKISQDRRGEGSSRYRCQHVNYVNKTNVPNEEEYLFSAYSVFTVKKVTWQANPTGSNPHVVELNAAIDNSEEPEDLPLAPWS